MEEPTANELFKDYYSAVTGTMAASVHGDKYRWNHGNATFPYPDQAKWTDFDSSITTCDGEEIARMRMGFRTFDLGLGIETDQARQEATNRVQAYWESRGWKVKDITGPNYTDIRIIVTTTDSGIKLEYDASIRGEAIDASTPCIAGFYDKYRDEAPSEEPITYPAETPDLNNLPPAPSTTTETSA